MIFLLYTQSRVYMSAAAVRLQCPGAARLINTHTVDSAASAITNRRRRIRPEDPVGPAVFAVGRRLVKLMKHNDLTAASVAASRNEIEIYCGPCAVAADVRLIIIYTDGEGGKIHHQIVEWEWGRDIPKNWSVQTRSSDAHVETRLRRRFSIPLIIEFEKGRFCVTVEKCTAINVTIGTRSSLFLQVEK